MDCGQWCSPCCCTGCKCNAILPWGQEACLIDECKGKKNVIAQKINLWLSCTDIFWHIKLNWCCMDSDCDWFFGSWRKQRMWEELHSLQCLCQGYTEGFKQATKIVCRGEKKNHLHFWKSPLCFPSVIFLHVPGRIVSILCKGSLSLVFIFCCLLLCLFVNKSVLLWTFAPLSSAPSELWEEHAGKWELS